LTTDQPKGQPGLISMAEEEGKGKGNGKGKKNAQPMSGSLHECAIVEFTT